MTSARADPVARRSAPSSCGQLISDAPHCADKVIE
jgi:hypothetical protein